MSYKSDIYDNQNYKFFKNRYKVIQKILIEKNNSEKVKNLFIFFIINKMLDFWPSARSRDS